jgi:hypothetical protein
VVEGRSDPYEKRTRVLSFIGGSESRDLVGGVRSVAREAILGDECPA